MAGTARRAGPHISRRRQHEARRRKYLRRRLMLLVLLLAAIVGAYFGIDWALARWLGPSAPEPPAAADLAFTPDVLMPVDFDGDTKPDAQIAVGPTKNAVRQIALATGTKAPYQQVGAAYEVPAFRLDVRNLTRAKNVLVMIGTLPTTGEPKKIDLPGGGKATEAAGGEPFFQAWRIDKEKGLVSDDFYALMAPDKPAADIVVNKWLNVLWFYKDGKLAATYRAATGRYLDGPAPSDVNQEKNYVTPVGTYAITNLQVNPPYNKLGIKGGDPKNPLGTRMMGFSVFAGDNANVWGIHGTDQPELIGKWVSDGCIRLKNQDAEKLFDQMKKGMTIEIVDTKV